MKANIGSVDKVLRIVVGLAAIGAGVYYNNYWGAIGLIPLGTALINWCPIYTILGVNTCSAAKQD